MKVQTAHGKIGCDSLQTDIMKSCSNTTDLNISLTLFNPQKHLWHERGNEDDDECFLVMNVSVTGADVGLDNFDA